MKHVDINPGDSVVVIEANHPYFKVGDIAKVISYDEYDDDFHCDFTVNENYLDDGIWYVDAHEIIKAPEGTDV